MEITQHPSRCRAKLRAPHACADLDLARLPAVDVWEASTVPTIVYDRSLTIVYASSPFLDATRSESRIVGQSLFDVFPESTQREIDLRLRLLEAFAGDANRANAMRYDFTGGKRASRWWEAVQTPLMAADGSVRWVVQQLRNVTEREDARRQRALVAEEMSHRVKNVLAVVQGVARLSGHDARTLDEYLDDLGGRLESMSRNHTRLHSNDFQGSELADLVKREIESNCPRDRVSVEGPARACHQRRQARGFPQCAGTVAPALACRRRPRCRGLAGNQLRAAGRCR